MNPYAQGIQKEIEQIKRDGAFVFDIDGTLLLPDGSLRDSREMKQLLRQLLEMGLRIALISGGPGAVVKNRILEPLKDELGEGKLTLLSQMTIFVNGGSSHYHLDAKGELVENRMHSERSQIPFALVERVKQKIESYLPQKFELSEEDFSFLKKVWSEKCTEQWQGLPITFQSFASEGKSFKLDYLDDDVMALAKIGESHAKTSFPFINIRNPKKKRNGNIASVSGFALGGFYELNRQNGDLKDLDVRDWIIKSLNNDLGEDAGLVIMRKAGRSSIDVTLLGVDKASALSHFIKEQSLSLGHVYYFGDEFYSGGNDEPIAKSKNLSGLNIFSVASNTSHPLNVAYLGGGPEGLQIFFREALDE